MSERSVELALVVPVYNEEGAIAKVLEDWVRALDALHVDFEIHAYDDGSTDRTGEILETIARDEPRVRVHRKANSGHGPTILQGYRENCDKPWIFQIDSDDEMKPDHFAPLWEARAGYDILVGERGRIGQPLPRKVVSLVSRATVHALFGASIYDVNAPYRLMRSASFAPVFEAIPADTFAPNLLVSGAASCLGARVFTTTVPQSQRTTGEVSIRKWKLLKAAASAFRQTATATWRIHQLRGKVARASGPAPQRSTGSWLIGGLLVASLVMNVVTARDRDALLAAMTPAAPRSGADLETAPSIDPDTTRHLAALGYAPYADVGPGDEASGVVQHDPALAADGLNVAFPEWACRNITFFRNDGTIVRRLDVSALPNVECYALGPIDDGFVFLGRPNLFRLDLEGRVRWKLVEGFNFHHDFAASEDEIAALDRWTFEDPEGSGVRIDDDRIVMIRPDGRVRKIISLHALFWDQLLATAKQKGVSPFDDDAVEVLGMDHSGDFYHANSIAILDRDSAIGKAGDLLVSLRTLDLVATIDPESERVVWSWGPGVLDHQHHPSLLDNGHVLVFDNGWHRGHSRVIEVDPKTKEIVWEYAPGSADAFFTKRRGGAYRLANGNTLVTESDRGRAFEVTREGEIVWDYRMPLAKSEQDVTRRQTLFRLQRLGGDRLARVLAAWSAAEPSDALETKGS